jgi:O-antigen/teichoic acid export membrane protein
MSLKKQAVGGVKWTSISAIISAIVQLLQVAILARFLGKKDFGLMAMALFVIGISQIFIGMGISNSIIHKQNVNKYQLSTLFWLNIFIGFAIFGVLFALSPAIADFYNAPELTGVLRWIALTFIIIPFGQQFETLLRKELRFKELSIRDIIGKLAGLIVAYILANYKFGVYSLVYSNLATAFISTILLVRYGLGDYRPMLIFSRRSLNGKGFFSFGLFQMGEQIVNYFNSQFDTLLIGKLLGMEALGIYNIAKTLAFKPYQIINPIITKVAFPLFAKVQHDVQKLQETYLKVIKILTTINGPIYAIIIILAKPLVYIFFGENWLAAVPFLQILSVSAFCNSIGNPVGALQLARGRADLGFYWNLGLFAFLPFSIWVGSLYGLTGVAYAITLAKIIIIIPAWRLFIFPLCQAPLRDYLLSIIKPSILAICCGLLAYSTLPFLSNQYLSFLTGSLIIIISYFLLNMFFDRKDTKELVYLLKRN